VVFVYHMRPEFLTGGFVGVDVFFVLSGFLISSHLLNELTDKGSIKFSSFWAKRARRLLPASFAVLITTAIGVWFLAPQALQDRFLRDISAAALYFSNWLFAADSVDYLAADNSPSIVQHFWSLSLEEQLYLVWPVVLGLAWAIFNRRGRGKLGLAVLLSIVVIASLAYSASLVADNNPIAYFSTFSRVWEFGAGALLALWVMRKSSDSEEPRAIHVVSAWLGWISLFAFVFLFNASQGFPGLNALIPVLATLLIIWGRDPSSAWSPARLTNLPPIQFLGNASYSIYLWHWPILMFLGFYYPVIPAEVLAVAALATLAVSWLSLNLIENPFRHGNLKAKLTPARTFLGAGAMMAVLVVSTQAAGASVRAEFTAQSEVAAQLEAELLERLESPLPEDPLEAEAEKVWDAVSCMGPAWLVEPECGEFSWDSYIPGIGVREDTAHNVKPLDRTGPGWGCFAYGSDYTLIRCTYGVVGGKKTVLIGDSHAYHWLPAFAQIATREGLELYFLARAGCPANTLARDAPADHVKGCFEWIDQMSSWIAAEPDIELALIANFNGLKYRGAPVVGIKQDTVIDGFIEAWKPILESAQEVVVLKDIPYIRASAWDCMVNNPLQHQKCDVSRDIIDAEFDNSAAAAEELGLRVLDMTDYFCTGDTCPMVVGGVRVYRDSNHMSGTYNLLLTPYLSRELLGEETR